MGRHADLLNRFSTTRVGRFLGSRVAARLDPIVFGMTRGRYTSTGPATLPLLALTTTGRRSGRKRTVQLAYVTDGDDWLVVGSNFGKRRHPDWCHNLDADPNAWILLDTGEEIAVRARLLTGAQKRSVWPRIEQVVPQMKVYPTLTDRDLRVYRLSRR